MKKLILATCVTGVTGLLAATAALADPPKFTAKCPNAIAVTSNGKGNVSINGEKVTVKTLSSTSWRTSFKDLTIDIGRDGAQVFVSSTGPGGDVCEVVSSSAAANPDGSIGGVPATDQKACLAAVSQQTNNGEVEVLDAISSEANNSVTIGVGKDKAKWQCLVKKGKVASVMSLTDEGAL